MPYRDEKQALEDRRADLLRRLAAVDRDAAELSRLAAESDALRRELDAIDARLKPNVTRGALPPLEDLRIASPCSVSWDGMKGDDRVRFCGKCEKHVYNLSAMARSEAEALVAETEGRICVRFFRRADGTVLTADCPVGQQKRRRRLAIVAVGASMVAAAGAAFAAQSHTTGAVVQHVGGVKPAEPVHVQGEPVMGGGGPPASPPSEAPPPPSSSNPPHMGRPVTGHWSHGARRPSRSE